jgi:hypothetical protein
LVGLADVSLADLSWADPALGYSGQGFFPMVRKISAIAFKQRIPGEKRIGIRTAADTDPVIADFLDLLNTPGQGTIELDNADTINGLAYLVSKDLLTADDAAAIRA